MPDMDELERLARKLGEELKKRGEQIQAREAQDLRDLGKVSDYAKLKRQGLSPGDVERVKPPPPPPEPIEKVWGRIAIDRARWAARMALRDTRTEAKRITIFRRARRIASIRAQKWLAGQKSIGGLGLADLVIIYDLNEAQIINTFLDRLVDYVGKDITSQLDLFGRLICQRARELTPIDTGTLAGGYWYTVDNKELNLGNDVEYFPPVESKYHMLEQAYSEYEPFIIGVIEDDARNFAQAF
jgi:hypothetical protein